MKLRAITLGLLIGAAAFAASMHATALSTKTSLLPVPLCPPDNPGCGIALGNPTTGH